jgi:hypothetical protein
MSTSREPWKLSAPGCWGVQGGHGCTKAARIAAFCLAAGLGTAAQTEELAPNGGFEEGFRGWTVWGSNANLVTIDEAQRYSGAASARIVAGHNAIFFRVPVSQGSAYQVRFRYRLEGEPSPAGLLRVGRFTAKGGLNSAGQEAFPITGVAGTPTGEWTEFRGVFMPSPSTATVQLTYRAHPGSTLWLDDVSLQVVPRPEGLAEPRDPWEGLARRTKNPLFHELLSDVPGGYRVCSWSHDLRRNPRPVAGSASAKDDLLRRHDDHWQREVDTIFEEAGQSGMGFMILPTPPKAVEAWHRIGFLREQHRRYGVTFDVWSEGSDSVTAALERGAEVVNPAEHALGKAAKVSLVDPHYVDAQEYLLRRLGESLRDEPIVGMFYGKDEPYGRLPASPPDARGSHALAMAEEVRESYGFGRYALPEPLDPAFNTDPRKPLRWLAFNRWFDDRFTASRARLSRALHEANPSARYSPANYWFMSGLSAFDYARLAEFSDVMTLDPYASSAEAVLRGRGVFNHGFGAKFMRDLTGKPVCVIAQAFDYAGYSMTPDDLREWVGQALRCGATEIQYYTMDQPRRHDPDRWAMMLHLSNLIRGMNRLSLPTESDTAVLYTLPTHMSHGPMGHGPASGGNQMYAAHALVGELAGSWFDFLSDAQLERGEKSLAGYKAVYLPIATIMTTESTRLLEEYVRGGGTLISGDASAFSCDPAGNDTADSRERILGVKLMGSRQADAIVLTDARWGLSAGAVLPVFENRLSEGEASLAASVIEPLHDAHVIAVYPDGGPAVVEHNLERGRVVTFAANPFAPAVAADESPWPRAIRGMQRSFGCQVDLPIWRFSLPGPTAGPDRGEPSKN